MFKTLVYCLFILLHFKKKYLDIMDYVQIIHEACQQNGISFIKTILSSL